MRSICAVASENTHVTQHQIISISYLGRSRQHNRAIYSLWNWKKVHECTRELCVTTQRRVLWTISAIANHIDLRYKVLPWWSAWSDTRGGELLSSILRQSSHRYWEWHINGKQKLELSIIPSCNLFIFSYAKSIATWFSAAQRTPHHDGEEISRLSRYLTFQSVAIWQQGRSTSASFTKCEALNFTPPPFSQRWCWHINAHRLGWVIERETRGSGEQTLCPLFPLLLLYSAPPFNMEALYISPWQLQSACARVCVSTDVGSSLDGFTHGPITLTLWFKPKIKDSIYFIVQLKTHILSSGWSYD